MSEPAPPFTPDPQAEKARRKRAPGWVWLILALGVILVAALIFVTVSYLLPADSHSSNEPSQSAPSISKGPPTAESTEPPAPAPIVLPSCEILLPEMYSVSAELASTLPEAEIQYGDIGLDRFSTQFGPAAQAALGASTQSQGCGFPTNLESGIWLYTMELPAESRQVFLSVLSADSDFVESTNGGAQVFTWEEALEGGHWASTLTTHAFMGDVWIASYGPMPPETHLPTVTAAILAANTGLG